MGLPDSYRSLGLQPPVYDPAVCVARDEARVAVHEMDMVDLGSVAAEDVAWLGGGACERGGRGRGRGRHGRRRLGLDVKGHR